VLGLARNIYYWAHGQLAGFLIGNVGSLDSNLRVPNSLRYYLPLDVPVFLTMPWMDSRDDATGRSNYWNYLLRSSLSGEFDFVGPMHRDIAFLWGAALLCLVILLVVNLIDRTPSLAQSWRDQPFSLLGLLWLLGSLSQRLAHPFSCIADFRLVYPLLVPFVFLCVRQGKVQQALLWVISLSSAMFFVSL
jgi:hypothetical protein